MITASTAANTALIDALGWDAKRGTVGMYFFILSEAMVFAALLFAYFYLGRQNARWPMDEPPRLMLAFVMLAVLLVSSGVVEWAKRRASRVRDARLALLVAIALGLGFLVLQLYEYADHLRTLTPASDAYGSIFYTITSVHAAHLALGLLMLAYAAILPRMGAVPRAPHRALHNAALYWHFVDAAWVVIVALLYVLPNVQR